MHDYNARILFYVLKFYYNHKIQITIDVITLSSTIFEQKKIAFCIWTKRDLNNSLFRKIYIEDKTKD